MKFHHRNDPGVKEWKFVYLPKNVALEKLLNRTVEILELDGIISVTSSEQIEDYVLNRGIFAGIEFNHSDVIIYSFFFCRILHFSYIFYV